MRARVWSACCFALLIGGCPKRQTNLRLVYVAPPPRPTPAASARDSGTWVIEEPTAPEPEVTKTPSEPPPPAPQVQLHPPKPRRGNAPAEASPIGVPDAPSLEPPPLEPADGAGSLGFRQKIETAQRSLSQRVAEFEHNPLSRAERRTLDEARAFLEQSKRALNEGDLRRAENLAYKADLLMRTFEQRH
jgi:hypothetical protein